MQSKSRKAVVKRFDWVVSRIVRKRDGKCVTCGVRRVTSISKKGEPMDNLQCGHLFSRKAYSTRWDLENCHAQCSGCNRLHEDDFHPLDEYVRQKLGAEAYEALHLRYRTPVKFSTRRLIEMTEEFKTKYKELLW